jgi:hypothetical protein
MAFLNNLFDRVRERATAPALPQIGALPQVTPVKQLTGIGAIPNTTLPMQTITLPNGQTVQIPQINMDEVNANLLAAGITPQMPTPAVTPATPVATPTIADNDPFASVERMPSADLPVATPAPVVTTPAVQAPLFNENIFDVGSTIGQQPAVTTPTELRQQALSTASEPLPTVMSDPAPEGSMNPNLNTLQPVVEGNFFGDNTPTPVSTVGQPMIDPAPAVTTPAALPAPKPMRPEDASQTNPDGTPYDTVGAGFKQNPFEDFKSPAATTPAVEQPLAPYTGAGYDAFGEQPFVGSVVRNETGLDALTKQLLFGLDGQGGFIPGAMQAAETTFFNPDGTPRVVEEQVAGLTPDTQAGMDLIRANVGLQDPFLRGAEGAFRQGVSDIGQGIERGRGFQQQGLQALQSGIGGLQGELGGVEGIARGAAGNFGTQLGGIAGRGIGATDAFGRRLGESEGLLRGTTGAYDQGLTSQFYNPYEDRVVQQTIDDVFEAGEKQDMAARARDIATGGESAFGSRARLSAAERREALGRGLGEALGGIRSRGFSEAQQTGLGEFARQRQAERLASSGLAGLSGQRLGAQQALGNQLTGLAGAQLGAQQNLGSTLAGLAGTRFGAAQTGAGALSNMGALEAQYGQDLAGAQFGLGSNLQNLGAARQQAGAFDVDQLLGSGQVQQAQTQAQLDAQRRNQIQAQQAPLAQYQALAPFVSMAPAGQFTTQTQFTPRPSALQAGLATGLGAFGAIGNFMNQGKG